jgi:hypothetical protein
MREKNAAEGEEVLLSERVCRRQRCVNARRLLKSLRAERRGKDRRAKRTSQHHPPSSFHQLLHKFLRSYSPHFRLTRPLAALPSPLRRLPPILIHFEVVLFSRAEEPAWLEPALQRGKRG